jgi:hypothetical protein
MRSHARRRATVPVVAAIALALLVHLGTVLSAPTPATPIPDGGSAGPAFVGTSGRGRHVRARTVPRHPFMAANGRSNIHDDAYMTDTYRIAGPLGLAMERTSTYFPPGAVCGSVTFDRLGRILSVCVSTVRPTLRMFDPTTLALLAQMDLPPRPPSMNPFQDFSGGGYFYLDDQDRAVIPTTTHHIFVVAEQGTATDPTFAVVRDYDASAVVPTTDKMTSALPDWSGRIWFVTLGGVVGTVDPVSGSVQAYVTGEQIENSFAVDRTGGVFIVSDVAMYRLDADASGAPAVTWREVYPNSGIHKPGQVNAGSGTTPTIMGRNWVSITDNADPMNVVVYRRRAHVTGDRLVCAQPVFGAGAGATENSLIAAGRAMIVENNYGYTGPTVTVNGASTTPGIERIDIDADGHGCHTVWHSDETAPSVVPKLSLRTGLVYTYTKPADPVMHRDSWYLTAIDFRTGKTRWSQLAGTGFYYNNNYAPVSLGPDGNVAYVGVLGGLMSLRDVR